MNIDPPFTMAPGVIQLGQARNGMVSMRIDDVEIEISQPHFDDLEKLRKVGNRAGCSVAAKMIKELQTRKYRIEITEYDDEKVVMLVVLDPYQNSIRCNRRAVAVMAEQDGQRIASDDATKNGVTLAVDDIETVRYHATRLKVSSREPGVQSDRTLSGAELVLRSCTRTKTYRPARRRAIRIISAEVSNTRSKESGNSSRI